MTTHRPSRKVGVVGAITLAALLVMTEVPAADAAPRAASAVAGQPIGAPLSGAKPVTDVSWLRKKGNQPVTAFVRTRRAGALASWRTARAAATANGRRSLAAAGKAAAAQTAGAANADNATLTKAVTKLDAKTVVLYRTAYTVPGIAVTARASALRTLAKRSDVASIEPISTMVEPSAAGGTLPAPVLTADTLTRAAEAWRGTKNTGKGVHVAVIDTGLDYTHADFGGPGTVAAYKAALDSTSAPQPALYDSRKYLGGWDFAGAEYSGTPGPGYDPQPDPDPNPIDGPGGAHGTHVTGTAAGYGVDRGKTFTGDYTKLTDKAVNAMDISPGAAPAAGVYALKIFGDGGGSTNLTGAAIEWIARSIVGGTRIDVVNLSLGSDFGAADDPDNAKLAALMSVGVLPVVAAGNAGDVTDVGGSPGSSGRVLTVAASASGANLADGVEATAPGSVAGKYTGQYSQNYNLPMNVRAGVVTLADPKNLNGCAAFSSADAARAKGKIVWLQWDDANIACGSATRFDNATTAGAVGVVLTSQAPAFGAGIGGNGDIPGIQLSATATKKLAASAAAGTLVLHLDDTLRLSIPQYSSKLRDTLAEFSSRGAHGSYQDVVKPDVAAPGVSILSAASGTGAARRDLSGTSMASPHVAGIAALVKQAHPTWSPDQIKTSIMNTAVTDVRDQATGKIFGVLRAGTGRVDAYNAVTDQTLVTTRENPGLVTASFGVVSVGTPTVTQTRTLVVSNKGAKAVTYRVAYSTRVAMPGVTISADRTSVTVGPRAAATVKITMRATRTALRRVADPTQPLKQGGMTRSYVPSTDGVVRFTPTTSAAVPLRVVAYAAPKPTAAMTAGSPIFTRNRANIGLAGTPLNQGSGSTGYRSLVAPFQLGATDPADVKTTNAPMSLRSIDVRAVGAATTAPQLSNPSNGMLAFGVATNGDWATASPASYPTVLIDVDRDGTTDYVTYASIFSRSVDEPIAVTTDLATGDTVDVEPLDVTAGSDLADTNVMVLPVRLKALGYTATTKATTLRYQVQTLSSYVAVPEGEFAQARVADVVKAADFDVFRPQLWFGAPTTSKTSAGSLLFSDRPGVLAVQRRSATTTASALLLHLNNASGKRWQVLAANRTARS